jgi:hypothetical protein
MSPDDPLQHEIKLPLASGAQLTLLYFSDREQRWIFSYHYIGEKDPGTAPQVVNDVKLTVDYQDGQIAQQIILSMHVIIPDRLGQQFFVGVDISPGAKTYLEFLYARAGADYRLVEICKGARDRVRLDETQPALVRPIEFPFPVLDRIPAEYGRYRVPFRTNRGEVGNFELPSRTTRGAT